MTIAKEFGSNVMMFVPEKIEQTMPRLIMRRSNDNESMIDDQQ